MAKAKMKSTGKMAADRGARGGFTIIEVVLVLAIAGLIFLMVFLALPALQTSQRDTQRRNALAEIIAKVEQYQVNNNGRLPADGNCAAVDVNDDGVVPMASLTGTGCSFVKNYLNGAGAVNNAWLDPQGWSYGLNISSVLKEPDFDRTVYIIKSAKCDGEVAVSSTNKRDFAVVYKLEGSGTFCQSNAAV